MCSFIKNLINRKSKLGNNGDNAQPVQPARGVQAVQAAPADTQNVVFSPEQIIIPSSEGHTSNPDSLSMEEQQVLRFIQDTHQRSDLLCWVMVVISLWLFLVLVILFMLGCGCLHLSENIIITLLVTTTANILGMAYLVLGDLFPKGEGALKTFINR